MSYQLELQKSGGAKPEIAMPPLPEENPTTVGQIVENEPEMQQDVVLEQPEAAQAAPIDEVAQNQQIPQESFQAKNFRQLKQETDRIKQERDEMAKRLQVYEMSQQRRQYEEVPQPEPEYKVDPGEIVEGRHLQQYAKKVQQLEQRLQQQNEANIAAMAQSQLRAKFPDFDKVVNEDNIEQLKYAYPELANTLNSSRDVYSTAVSAYTMIKKLGIVPEEDYMAQKAQAQKNVAKPRPLASVSPQQGDSPLSKANAFANGLTDELRKQLLREMNEARK
jgi:flagellar biosynthesis/type III secretory pathway chaperone